MTQQIGDPVWEAPATVDMQQGNAEMASGAAADEHPVAVLWLIDPEARRGFREYYVKKQAPKPGGKLMGYRK